MTKFLHSTLISFHGETMMIIGSPNIAQELKSFFDL